MTLDEVRYKIEQGAYEPDLAYPMRPVKFGAAKRVSDLKPEDVDGLREELERYELKYQAYLIAKAAYDKSHAEHFAYFWQDLAEATGMTEHPRRAKLEGLTWERGHSGGLSEVLDEYCELVGLLQ